MKKKILSAVCALMLVLSFGTVLPERTNDSGTITADAAPEIDWDAVSEFHITVTGGDAAFAYRDGMGDRRLLKLDEGENQISSTDIDFDDGSFIGFYSAESYIEDDDPYYVELEEDVEITVDYADVKISIFEDYEFVSSFVTKFSGDQAENLFRHENALSDDNSVKYTEWGFEPNDDTASEDDPDVTGTETYGSYEYETLEDGTVAIIRYKGSDAEITVPSTINDKKVTSISAYAFDTHPTLSSVIIPSSVTSIGEGAFYWCSKLKSVTIPDSVTSIDDEAFTWCYDLTIYCYKNSTAHEYAINNGIPFVLLEDDEPTLDITLNTKDNEIASQKFTMTVDGGSKTESENASVAIPEMADGKHVLKFESEHFVAREYEVTVKGGEIIDLPEIKLNLVGDINGDGEIKATDLLLDKSHIKGVGVLTGYELKCADVDGNGKVNAADLLKMKAHMKGVSSIWE